MQSRCFAAYYIRLLLDSLYYLARGFGFSYNSRCVYGLGMERGLLYYSFCYSVLERNHLCLLHVNTDGYQVARDWRAVRYDTRAQSYSTDKDHKGHLRRGRF